MNTESSVEYRVLVHHEDGAFWAEVAELPGCFAAGDSLEELWEGMAEAISLYLSTPDSKVVVRGVEREMVSEAFDAKMQLCS